VLQAEKRETQAAEAAARKQADLTAEVLLEHTSSMPEVRGSLLRQDLVLEDRLFSHPRGLGLDPRPACV
jgi:hypothetical protein